MSGEFVLIPKQMLKSDEAIMLDGMKIDEVAEAIGVPVYAVTLEELSAIIGPQRGTKDTNEIL